MPQQNEYKKTVKYSEETDEKLQKLADQAGCAKRDFFIQMVEYFYRTKKDPKDINDELLKKTLTKNHDTYIRFIRARTSAALPDRAARLSFATSRFNAARIFAGPSTISNREAT